MTLPENIKDYFSLNGFVALVLFAATCFIMVWILKLLLKKKSEVENTPATDSPAKTKVSEPFKRCELNEIMGYDFIQIKTPELNITTTTKEDTKRPKSFNESEGMGMTEMPLKTTGATSEQYEDEPTLSREQRLENIKQEEKNKKFEQQAKQEEKTLATEDTMLFMLGNIHWPEVRDDVNQEEYDAILDKALINDGGDLTADVEDDEGNISLQQEPENKQEYDDLQMKLNEFELQDALNGGNLSDEELESLSNIDNN